MDKWRRRFHRSVGLAAATLSLIHIGAVLGVWAQGKTDLHWLLLQVMIGVAIFLPAFWMLRSERFQCLSAIALTAVSMYLLLRFFVTLPAVFTGLGTIAALLAGIARAFSRPRPRWAFLTLSGSIAFFSICSVVVGSAVDEYVETLHT